LRVAILLLAVIGLYRVSDIVLGVVANIFYQDMGFTIERLTIFNAINILAAI
jgi:PAT family beta-lactamase induction signal transducer AmpG